MRATQEEIGRSDRWFTWHSQVSRNLFRVPPANSNRSDVRPPEADPLSEEGVEFAVCIKKNYQAGFSLWLPGEHDWLIKPEYFLNEYTDLGTFEEPIVLAMVAARDPTAIMSLAATARLTPRAKVTPLLKDICDEISNNTIHEVVRNCLVKCVRGNFRKEYVDAAQVQIQQSIDGIRSTCFDHLRRNFEQLLHGAIVPRIFIGDLLEKAEESNIKISVYRQLVVTLLLSKKVRPAAKFLLLEQLVILPKAVIKEIITTIANCPRDEHTAFLKEELDWIIRGDPSLLGLDQVW
jgi:hypothetical protein